MAVYQNTIANLGVKLEITHASPDVANNRTTITYKASVYKTGSHNPWNALSQTPMYLTINGQSLHSTATGNYDLRSGTYEQVIKTGTLVVPHGADGSKSFTFSWNVNFTSTGYGYGNVTTSGTYVLPNIARASTFTIPSTTITTGSAFTVTIARASGSFTHKVSYVVGNSEVVWTSSAATSYAATVPHSLFNSHKSTASVSGVIRVTTMNGSVEVGSNQRAVTINLNSTAIPTVGSLSNSNSNKALFSNASQYIRGMSRLTATAGSVSGSYSSTIASYEFRVVRANGSTVFGATSKTTSSHQFSAFDFPNSSSEVVTPQVRVRDSRGRYSAWRAASAIRVHYYAPPAIGTTTVRRVGSANTTLQVTRNYSITLLYESGAGSNINTASLRFQHRTKGSTGATDNAGAKSTTTSLSNSNANLSGTFSASTSYEVRAILSDKINTVYGSWISVGTEFVPMDIGPKGVGVGKVHSNGGYNLEVGSGGINSEGNIRVNGSAIQAFKITADNGSPMTTVANLNNRVTGLESISTTTSNSPVSYGTVLGLNGFEILIGSDSSARFRRWSGSPSVAGTWLNAMDKDGTSLPQNYNLDNAVETGYYYVDSNARAASFTNAPTEIMAGFLEVFKSGSMRYQKWTNYGATSHANKVFIRGRSESGSWSAWVRLANMDDIPTVPHTFYGVYTDNYLRTRIEVSTGRIMSGIATAAGNATSTFNSLGNTVTFPIAFSSNTNYKVMVTYSISSNVTPVQNRMITVNIRNVTRTGFVWDARDSASGTSPSGGTVYTLHWIATGTR